MADQPSDNAATPTPQRTSGGTGRWVPPSAEHLQQLLPQYEVIEMLGAGGMGAVYKARQISLDRLVAIKILPPGIVGDADANFTERFINEARTMAKLNHPAIVHVHDFGQTAEGQLYFVMEYVDGTDVAKMIQSQGRLPPDYALAITAHVCDALKYAHDHGVIHRDIKPANVLINMEGQVKVADFGLAKANDASRDGGLTKSSMTMGTPDFIAPEALTMGMTVDQRADLYAVGVMLYNMLTGRIPRGAFDLPSVKAGCDPRFDAIVLRALKTEPTERYQDAREIRHDLDVILTVPLAKRDSESGAVPKSFARKNIPHRPVAQRPGAVPSAPSYAPVPAPKKKSGALMALAAAAVLGTGGFFAWQQYGKGKPSQGQGANAGSSDSFIREVAALLPDAQVQRVMTKLKELNPGFDPAEAQEKHTIVDGKVTALDFRALKVTDISPLRALTALTELNCGGISPSAPNSQRSPLSDLSPLRGLPLKKVVLYHASVSDLAPLKGMKLEEFHGNICPLEDLSPLAGMPLRFLSCYQTNVTSLVPLRGMPLKNLIVDSCPVTDLSPLAGMTTLEQLTMRDGPASDLSPLQGLKLRSLITGGKVRDFSVLRGMPVGSLSGSVERPRDVELLRSIPSLKTINGKSAESWLSGSNSDAIPAGTALTFAGHRYQFVREKRIAWAEARTKAEAMGGHLATISSKEEDEWARELLKPYLTAAYHHCWIGASAETKGGSWRWITGEPFTFTAWAPGEPSYHSTPPYGLNYHLKPGKGLAWNDSSSQEIVVDDFTEGFLVEWEGDGKSTPVAAEHTFAGHRYQFFPDKLSWDAAKAKAESLGGHLATITSKEENDWIAATFVAKVSKGLGLWLGASSPHGTDKATWKWVTGEPMIFQSWKKGRPQNAVATAMLFSSSESTGIGWTDMTPSGVGANDWRGGFLVEWDDDGKTTPAVAATPPTMVPAAVADEIWTDWLADQKRIGKLPDGLKEENGGYTVTSPMFFQVLGLAMKDGAVRLTFKRKSSPTVNVLVRCVDPAPIDPLRTYTAAYRVTSDGRLMLHYRERKSTGPLTLGTATNVDLGDVQVEHVVELRAKGEQLTVMLDGQSVIAKADTRCPQGVPAIYADKGAWFRKIEVLNLDKAATPPIPDLLLKQYTDALARNRKTAPAAERVAYDAEIARLKSDPTIPASDDPGIPDALKKLRQILRQEVAKQK